MIRGHPSWCAEQPPAGTTRFMHLVWIGLSGKAPIAQCNEGSKLRPSICLVDLLLLEGLDVWSPEFPGHADRERIRRGIELYRK